MATEVPRCCFGPSSRNISGMRKTRLAFAPTTAHTHHDAALFVVHSDGEEAAPHNMTEAHSDMKEAHSYMEDAHSNMEGAHGDMEDEHESANDKGEVEVEPTPKAAQKVKNAKKVKKDQKVKDAAQKVKKAAQKVKKAHKVKRRYSAKKLKKAQKGEPTSAKAAEVERADDNTTIVTEMPLVKPRLLCSRCRKEVDDVRCQITGKSRAVVRCNRCNTRAVQLSRLSSWGGFSQRLRGMSEAERVDFWRSSHDAKTPEALRSFLAEKTTLASPHAERMTAQSSGSYLPLSVYSAQGYDAQRIQDFCTDKVEDPVLGTLYRLTITTKPETAEESRVVTQTVTRGSTSGGAGPEATAASSEPSATPPAPNEKEVPLKTLQAQANKILGRTAMIVPAMQICLRPKSVDGLPAVVVQSANAVLAELQQLETEAKKTLRGQPSLSTTLAEANALAPRPGARFSPHPAITDMWLAYMLTSWYSVHSGMYHVNILLWRWSHVLLLRPIGFRSGAIEVV